MKEKRKQDQGHSLHRSLGATKKKKRKMKKVLVGLLMLVSYCGYGQERRLDVSYSMGGYTTPYYDEAEIGLSYSADFDYLLNNNWYISLGFTLASFDYFEPPIILEPDIIVVYGDGRNGTVRDRIINLKVKKDLLKKEKYNVRVGLGFSILTEIRDYALTGVPNPGSFSNFDSAFTSLAFPVSVEPFYVIADRFRVGLKAELYVQPDFPILGYNLGPQIRIRL